MDIVELLKKPESKTLEFKRDLSSPANVLRSMIAFANTSGGVLIIGVEDKTKKICGIDDPLLLEEKLANIITDCIEPKIVPEIEVISYRNNYLLVIEIHPSSMRPHFLKKNGETEGTYIRVGSTNRLADKTIIAEIRRFVLDESFDEQAFPQLSSEAINFIVASELFSQVCKFTPSSLETLNIVTKYQGHKVPTIGGVILFCADREKYFPYSWIQAGRFVGNDKRRIVDTVELKSYPVVAIDDAMDFVRKHSMHALEIKGVKHKERWSLPLTAIREAIINAVVHADYAQGGAPIRLAIFDNRVEIENPGLLPFGLTIDDIKRGVSKLRNRVIGRVFHKLGLIEHWGSGVQRIIGSCQEAGFAEPVFEEIGTHFRVTIYTEQKTNATLDIIDHQILKALADFDGCSMEIIANLIHRSKRAARSRMLNLIDKGIVVEIGLSSKDPHKKYFLIKK